MTTFPLVKYGLLSVHDTGAPEGKDEYLTLAILHGYAWQSGMFRIETPEAFS